MYFHITQNETPEASKVLVGGHWGLRVRLLVSIVGEMVRTDCGGADRATEWPATGAAEGAAESM